MCKNCEHNKHEMLIEFYTKYRTGIGADSIITRSVLDQIRSHHITNLNLGAISIVAVHTNNTACRKHAMISMQSKRGTRTNVFSLSAGAQRHENIQKAKKRAQQVTAKEITTLNSGTYQNVHAGAVSCHARYQPVRRFRVTSQRSARARC